MSNSRIRLDDSLAFFELNIPAFLDAGLNVEQAVDRISDWMLSESAPENHAYIRSKIAAMRGPLALAARLQNGTPIPKSRAEIEQALRVFEDALPALANSLEPAAIDSICRLAETLISSAAPSDLEFVRERLNCLLGSVGVIPSDNEGEPCR